MNTASILIKVDKESKEAAHKAAKEIGVPLGTILSAYVKQFSRDKRVSFSVSPTPNLTTKALIKEIDRDFKAGKNIKNFSSVDDLAEDLLA